MSFKTGKLGVKRDGCHREREKEKEKWNVNCRTVIKSFPREGERRGRQRKGGEAEKEGEEKRGNREGRIGG